MIKILLPSLISILVVFTGFGQIAPDSTSQKKNWTNTLSISLNYNGTKLTNPPLGVGINSAGGNMTLNYHAFYLNNEKRNFWSNDFNWNFGLLRLGSGPLQAGSDQKIPFQKTLDLLEVTSTFGHRFDDKFSIVTGIDFRSQALPSYQDPEGQVRGVFLNDIRNSNTNPILSNFLAPGYLTVYAVGIGYQPSPKLFIGYSPATYKGILVFDDNIASLVGQVDANGLPTATVYGNRVEINNGVPVFKNSFNQFGSFLMLDYKDQFLKGKLSYVSDLKMFSNYLNKPEKIDLVWRNTLAFNIMKGLSLTYTLNLFYDYDVLVAITDDSVPGGFSGEFGRKLSTQRMLMLRYQIKF